MVQDRQDWFFCEVYGKVFATVGDRPFPNNRGTNENGGTMAAASKHYVMPLGPLLGAPAHSNRARQTGAEQRQGDRLRHIAGADQE